MTQLRQLKALHQRRKSKRPPGPPTHIVYSHSRGMSMGGSYRVGGSVYFFEATSYQLLNPPSMVMFTFGLRWSKSNFNRGLKLNPSERHGSGGFIFAR